MTAQRDPSAEQPSVADAIRLRGVSFAFRKGRRTVPVLESFNLSVADGEIVALLGESGQGKSTALSLVSGERVPDGGSVEVLGFDLARMSRDARAQFRLANIAQIYQDFQLLPMLTAVDNVALPLSLRGMPRARATDMARSALADVGMARRLEHRPGELSGGEQQRVAIARAVVCEPKVLLADEPTGSLDADRRDEILNLMLEELRGTTTILVTHDPAVAGRAHRTVLMS
ncbi:MAG: ABC transporter ATP-binding protein [Chloroflexi bacterium]|nr:ABC transporter ATP-binding protein [Chloroflexota bacterium]